MTACSLAHQGTTPGQRMPARRICSAPMAPCSRPSPIPRRRTATSSAVPWRRRALGNEEDEGGGVGGGHGKHAPVPSAAGVGERGEQHYRRHRGAKTGHLPTRENRYTDG